MAFGSKGVFSGICRGLFLSGERTNRSIRFCKSVSRVWAAQKSIIGKTAKIVFTWQELRGKHFCMKQNWRIPPSPFFPLRDRGDSVLQNLFPFPPPFFFSAAVSEVLDRFIPLLQSPAASPRVDWAKQPFHSLPFFRKNFLESLFCPSILPLLPFFLSRWRPKRRPTLRVQADPSLSSPLLLPPPVSYNSKIKIYTKIVHSPPISHFLSKQHLLQYITYV